MANASINNETDNLTSVLYGVRDLRLVSKIINFISYLQFFICLIGFKLFFSVRNNGRYQNRVIMVTI